VNTQALQAEHRKFLNTYYGISRHFYDWTRKYYLLGRDRELRALLREEWTTLVEIGPWDWSQLAEATPPPPPRVVLWN
jgi:S-adenosylmethionine-diacylgycerolhomoserine-N-methlytransferase